MSLLITGTGRCRTAWTQAVLSNAGMAITHQSIQHRHCLDRWLLRGLATSDVSFEAAPLARTLADDGWSIGLLVRDPVEVVRSWLSLGAFNQAMHLTHIDWWTSMRVHCPVVTRNDTDDPVERATRFYVAWNLLALAASPEIILPVESLTAQGLGEIMMGPGSYSDPGLIDHGTPGRLPIVLDEATRSQIRQRARDDLGEAFDYTERIA